MRRGNTPWRAPSRQRKVQLLRNPEKSQEPALFASVRPITRGRSLRDAIAGLQLAALSIPQALGYTKIAGTPIVTGFYTLLLPPIAFAAFGSSRYLVVAADSATAAIMAGGLVALAPLASARYMALAETVALLTALMLLFARILKLGFLADFLSQTVLVGFLTGVGFQVGIAVLGEMIGVEVRSQKTIFQIAEIVRGIPSAHLLTAAIAFLAVAEMLILHQLKPTIPGALIAVVGSIVASAYWNLGGQGVAVIGSVGSGLPHLSFPNIEWHNLQKLVPIAGSCFVVIVAQSAATARFYAARHRELLNEDADLVGLAAANTAAALSGAFVVDGSPTQTSMVEASGARSQIAQLATAIVVALVLLFLTSPLQYLPQCVLGAIVFVIAVRLIDFRGLSDIRRESSGEYALAILTAAIVVLLGIEQAILVAMALSLMHLMRHIYRPQSGVLVADENQSWNTQPPRPGTVTEPGLVIYRFGASLFYANAGRFVDEVRDLTSTGEVRWLVVDTEAIPNLDYTAARMIRELHEELVSKRVELSFARVAPSLRSDLLRHRIIDPAEPLPFFDRLHDARNAFAASAQKSPRN